MMTDLVERKKQLEVERDALAERLQRINLDYRSGLDQDWEEQSVQLENADVLREIARVTAEELGKIDSAIQHIEQALRQQSAADRD